MPTTYFFDASFKDRDASTDERAGQEINETAECFTTGDPAPSPAHVVAAFATQEGIYKGQPHPGYSYALCTNVRAQSQAEPNHWILRVRYLEPAPQPGQPLNPGGAGTPSGNPQPEARPPQISGSFRREQEYRTIDLDDEPIDNAVLDPLEGAPPFYGGIGIMQITKWYTALAYSLFMSYQNKCNSATWNGFAADMLLITGVSWKPKTERGWLGWEVDFTIEHKPLPANPAVGQTGGWIPTRILDRGWNCRKIAGGPKVSARSLFGEQLAEPVLLAADGTRLPEASAPRYISARYYDRISYAILD